MMTALEKREIFHLSFLRALVRKVPPSGFALKGGSNLRFFFGSIRYSEDMDLDVEGIAVHVLSDQVMSIIESPALRDALRTFGIDEVVPPDLAHAKQTETVQRFKVHLITSAGEDLFTKVEFSRRGLDSPLRAEAISTDVLARYRMPPLIAPHYTAEAAARQKIGALLSRPVTQARDVFDLYVLSARPGAGQPVLTASVSKEEIEGVRDRIFSIGYQQYRDTVVSYLGPADQDAHDSPDYWDEIRLRALSVVERQAEGNRVDEE